MAKKAPAEELPANPEFDKFAEFTRELMKVPKKEIDRRVAEDAERRNTSRKGD